MIIPDVSVPQRSTVGVLIDSGRQKVCPFRNTRYHPGSVTSPLEMSRDRAKVAFCPEKNICFLGKEYRFNEFVRNVD